MILYRYIIKEHVLPFFYSLFTILFMFMMNLAVELLRRIIYKGLDWNVIAELFIINMAWMFVLAVPMSILVSTLMAFGKMSADNEILAIKASGRNLYYLLTPVISAAFVITVLLVYFHNLVLPDANHKAASLMSDISRKKPAALIEPNVIIRDFKNYSIIVDNVDHSTGLLSGVKIFANVPGKDPATTVAKSGKVQLTADEKFLQLNLYNGETHTIGNENGADYYYIAKFVKQVVYIPNVDSRLKRTERRYRGDREKSSYDLLDDVKRYRNNISSNMRSFNKSLDELCQKTFKYDSLSGIRNSVSKISSVLDSIGSFESLMVHLSRSKSRARRFFESQRRFASSKQSQIVIDKKRINQNLVEVHKKFSISFACIIFVLIGAPLGIMAKKGGIAVGATYSIFFFVLYWALLILGESLADKLILSPVLAMWSGNVIIGIAGIFIILKMVRETTFIRLEPVKTFLIKFLPKHKKIRHIFISHNPILRAPVVVSNFIFRIASAYLIRNFFRILFTVLFSLIVVFVIVDYVSNLNRFVNASFVEVLKYYGYYLAWFTGVVLPIAILLSSMFAMGALVKSSELTALKASGMSIYKLTMPILFIAVLFTVADFFISEKVLPVANQKRKQLEEDFKSGENSRVRVRGFKRDFFYFTDDNTVFHFSTFKTKPQEALNVRKEVFSEGHIIERIDAKRMSYSDDGKWYFVGATRRFFTDSGFIKTAIFDTLFDSSLTSKPDGMITRITRDDESLGYWELKKHLEDIKNRGEDITKYIPDLYFKIAMPFMNLIVMLLGVSIAALTGKRGGAVNFGIGLAVVFSYWIISQIFLAFGRTEHLSPQLAAWSGNIIFFLLGLVLFRKAAS